MRAMRAVRVTTVELRLARGESRGVHRERGRQEEGGHAMAVGLSRPGGGAEVAEDGAVSRQGLDGRRRRGGRRRGRGGRGLRCRRAETAGRAPLGARRLFVDVIAVAIGGGGEADDPELEMGHLRDP